MWNTLKKIYLKIDQKVVYLVLQKILNYSYIYKPKKYNKPVVKIFTKI